jgi:hypothetical protein
MTLHARFSRIDEVPNVKHRRALEQHRDQADLAMQLVSRDLSVLRVLSMSCTTIVVCA